MLVPGLAFDRTGTRAGYGGGYYDTYLEGHAECTKAALAYSAQIAPEIPADPTDIKVDMIVTEEELILCSQDFRRPGNTLKCYQYEAERLLSHIRGTVR